MEEIGVPESDEDPGATIPAETMLDSNRADDWKVARAGLTQKHEDQSNKEVCILIRKQPTTVKEKSIATPHQVASAVGEK